MGKTKSHRKPNKIHKQNKKSTSKTKANTKSQRHSELDLTRDITVYAGISCSSHARPIHSTQKTSHKQHLTSALYKLLPCCVNYTGTVYRPRKTKKESQNKASRGAGWTHLNCWILDCMSARSCCFSSSC